MIDCLIVGDSIAVGAHAFKTECAALARGGINSWQFNQMYPMPLDATSVVISLGSNDHAGVRTQHELEAVRARVHGKRVFWILPAGNLLASNVPITKIQAIIREIATANGDIVLEIPSLQPDHIHPSWAGYRALMEHVDGR